MEHLVIMDAGSIKKMNHIMDVVNDLTYLGEGKELEYVAR